MLPDFMIRFYADKLKVGHLEQGSGISCVLSTYMRGVGGGRGGLTLTTANCSNVQPTLVVATAGTTKIYVRSLFLKLLKIDPYFDQKNFKNKFKFLFNNCLKRFL